MEQQIHFCTTLTEVYVASRIGIETEMGTLEHMSPEQARAQETDVRSDVWSTGCVIYEMLSGKGAFARKSGVDTLAAILGEEPTPIREIEPSVPVELQRIITRMLEKKRSDRY
jgi:serine/threonine protein kinase